jgi:hypothetical protein
VADRTRVTVYVDGFNLYYGLLKPNPAVKWLDLSALATALRPEAVTVVRYFTAKVRPVPDPTARDRQRLYLKALEFIFREYIADTTGAMDSTRQILVKAKEIGALSDDRI